MHKYEISVDVITLALCAVLCAQQIEFLKTYFMNLRQSDTEIDLVFERAIDIAGKMGIAAEFPPERRIRLFDLGNTEKTIDQCKRLEAALAPNFVPEPWTLSSTQQLSSASTSKNIDATELFSEIHLLQSMNILPRAGLEPLQILNYLISVELLELFPNLTIALKIVLTIPVGVASAEGRFSKLKIIKNYLRTTMAQDRLSNLATISIERDIVQSINVNAICEKFASLKTRRVRFQMHV